MDVIFVINQMGGVGCGGADRVVGILANSLKAKGHDVTILALTDNCIVDRDLIEGVKIVFISPIKSRNKKIYNIKRLFFSVKLIRQYMKANPNAVFISFINWVNMCTIIAKGWRKVYTIISERTDPRNEPTKKVVRMLRNYLYKFADKIVFQTQNAKAYFSKIIQNKGVIIANPIKDSLPLCDYSFQMKRIVAVGRLEKQKNMPLLIEAFEEFDKLNPGYVLEIYGQGKLFGELKQLICERKLEGKVNLKGFHANVCELICNASMYVIASDFEGMSNSMLEALAMGLPVISTDCPAYAARELIESYENGILIPVNDKSKLVEAMCYLANNEEHAKAMGQKAALLRKELSTDSIIRQWMYVIGDENNEKSQITY